MLDDFNLNAIPKREFRETIRTRSYSSLSGWRPECVGGTGERMSGEFFARNKPLSRRLTGRNLSYILMLPALILCWSGCAPKAPTSPVVQTNLYGDLDSWKPVKFSPKPFSSLGQHSFCEEGGDYDPDISQDGNWMVFSSLRHSPNPDLYVKRIAGKTTTRLTSDPASEIEPAFSPSGDKVAYASNRSGSWDIWVIGVDGTNPTRVTDNSSNDIHPSWSPDGKQIVYCSYGGRSQQWELWVVEAENPSVKKWIGYGLFPVWCPNPEIPKIAFQLARYRGSQWFSVWTLDLVDGESKYPTEIVSSVHHACICPTWSAEGNKLAYSTVTRSRIEESEPEVPDNSGEDIWVVDLNGQNNLRLTQADASNFSPCWSPDGRVYYCSDRKGIDNIWSMKPREVNFSASAPVDLSEHPQAGLRAN